MEYVGRSLALSDCVIPTKEEKRKFDGAADAHRMPGIRRKPPASPKAAALAIKYSDFLILRPKSVPNRFQQ